MIHLIIRLLANAAGLYMATRIVPGISFTGDATTLVIVALIFGLVNALVKPVLSFLTCPPRALDAGAVHLCDQTL